MLTYNQLTARRISWIYAFINIVVVADVEPDFASLGNNLVYLKLTYVVELLISRNLPRNFFCFIFSHRIKSATRRMERKKIKKTFSE